MPTTQAWPAAALAPLAVVAWPVVVWVALPLLSASGRRPAESPDPDPDRFRWLGVAEMLLAAASGPEGAALAVGATVLPDRAESARSPAVPIPGPVDRKPAHPDGAPPCRPAGRVSSWLVCGRLESAAPRFHYRDRDG
ncbi:hypothetical protein WCLP8_3810013 [uncultured Gammaproteobacteria bacterium]